MVSDTSLWGFFFFFFVAYGRVMSDGLALRKEFLCFIQQKILDTGDLCFGFYPHFSERFVVSVVKVSQKRDIYVSVCLSRSLYM